MHGDLQAQRVVGRLAHHVEGSVPDLDPSHPVRQAIERLAGTLVDSVGLAPIAEANGYLDAAEGEVRERFAEANLAPWTTPNARQEEILLRGMPFTVVELDRAARSAAKLWVPEDDRRSREEVAGGLAAIGIIEGAIASAWSR